MGAASSLNATALMADAAIPKHCSNQNNSYQNCNFLSLFAGGVIGPVAANIDNQRGAGFESLPQIHVPYLQSIFHHNQLTPFAIPHVRYPSSQQVQLAQYSGNPSYSPQLPSHVSSVPHQQQQTWTAQYMPGPGGIGVSWNHSPKWQSGGLDSASLLPCTRPILSSSCPSEVFGAKSSPAIEQQQIFAFSSSSSEGKTMRCLLPSYDGSGIRFYPEVSFHLQLLCNGEHL